MEKIQSKAKSFFTQYGLHLIFLFFFINLTGAYVLHYSVIATGCMTITQVQTDNRCLYIWNNQVYQPLGATRALPHNSHPCGTDVTSIVPATHLGAAGMAAHLLPSYIANVCVVTSVPPKPTQSPIP